MQINITGTKKLNVFYKKKELHVEHLLNFQECTNDLEFVVWAPGDIVVTSLMVGSVEAVCSQTPAVNTGKLSNSEPTSHLHYIMWSHAAQTF